MINNKNEEKKRKVQNRDTSTSRVTPGGDQQISHQMEHAGWKQDEQHQREVVQGQKMTTDENGDVVTGRRIRLLSRALFPVLYLIFIAVYWSHFSPNG